MANVGEAPRALLAGRREREGEREKGRERERELRGERALAGAWGADRLLGVCVWWERGVARGRDLSMCVTASQDLFCACAVRASLSLRERASTSERCHMRRARLSSRD